MHVYGICYVRANVHFTVTNTHATNAIMIVVAATEMRLSMDVDL